MHSTLTKKIIDGQTGRRKSNRNTLWLRIESIKSFLWKAKIKAKQRIICTIFFVPVAQSGKSQHHPIVSRMRETQTKMLNTRVHCVCVCVWECLQLCRRMIYTCVCVCLCLCVRVCSSSVCMFMQYTVTLKSRYDDDHRHYGLHHYYRLCSCVCVVVGMCKNVCVCVFVWLHISEFV